MIYMMLYYVKALYNADTIMIHSKILMPRPLSNPLKNRISSFSLIIPLPAFHKMKHQTSASDDIS